VFVDRIPLTAAEKFEAERVPGKAGSGHQLINDQHQHAKDGEAAHRHGRLENTVRKLAG
jgi:hypothetical protein